MLRTGVIVVSEYAKIGRPAITQKAPTLVGLGGMIADEGCVVISGHPISLMQGVPLGHRIEVDDPGGSKVMGKNCLGSYSAGSSI